jgi:hypothetical protein
MVLFQSLSVCVNQTQACRSHNCKCHIHTRVCGNYTLRAKSHSVGGNCTFRVDITLVRVEVTV